MHNLASCLLIFLATAVAGNISFAQAEASHSHRIMGPFEQGPDVTRVCLKCHQQEAHDFTKDVHWTWSTQQYIPGHKQAVALGKKNAINNFCISVPSNWEGCTSCHAGYGWKNESFDFKNIENIDCLVCHDTTGLYTKDRNRAGIPNANVDLEKIAKQVGNTSRKTCGSCHFFGGGGDHIKHGDLDTSLISPTRDYDVHMGVDGANMSCQTCHQTKRHRIPGQAMSVSTGAGKRVECGGCHNTKPHSRSTLNQHMLSVACQTCHIPSFAKDQPTKIWADWSSAGADRIPEKDQFGMDLYAKSKGEMRWGKNIIPTYSWYDGKSDRYIPGDKINPRQPIYLSRPTATIDHKDAKIFPFKLMAGKQPYDTVNNYLVVPNLFGGYWQHFDWNQSITDGMAAVNLPYSGKYDFVETKMYWQITHMVVPKEQSLKCQDCHGETGRLDWQSLGYKGDPRKFGSRRLE